jgi:NAD(P)H-dependent flavin oxidoreductase YrpB (nitropropane dioxygenase family)
VKKMIRTRICDVLGIEHPVVLGGFASITAPDLAAAVSEAGGLGGFGGSYIDAGQIRDAVATLRAATDRPFAINFLMFVNNEAGFAAALEAAPPVMAFAWPEGGQDLATPFARAHAAGCKVMFMAGGVDEAKRAAEAGADVIVAQGTEGGGHVGWMAASVLVPMIVDAVAPIPVLAAGGVVDGRGLVSALAMGAEGVLLGTRFLATEESPLHANFKQVILDSDGHDTVLTEVPDLVGARVWPGAMARAKRNRFIDRWSGREWALRQHQADANATLRAAQKAGDADEASLLIGQDAGLIDDLPPAGELVTRIVAQAEEIIARQLPGQVQPD